MNKIHKVLISSRAAIDLASIMVGIIIIGLIGGVIAATVFAVIPWSQDKAAKQQLESVHIAENAFFGLSSDANVSLKKADGTVGSFRNSFAGSGELAANELLNLNKEGLFCVVATIDGNDYHAYAKSGSGKWFSATNSKKIPVEYTGSVPCVNSTVTPIGSGTQTPGTVDTGVDTGAGQIPTMPVSGTTPGSGSPTTPTPAPTVDPGPTLIATYNFEDSTVQGFSPNLYPYGTSVTAIKYSYTGSYSLKYISPSDSSDVTRSVSRSVPGIVAGETYRVTSWVYWSPEQAGLSSVDFTAFGNSSYKTLKGVSPVPAANKWTQVTYEVVAKASAGKVNSSINFNVSHKAYYSNTIYVDDITVEKIS